MADLAAPPVLSTPDDHLFELPDPTTITTTIPLPDDTLRITYEISRTVTELRLGDYKRVALQFPDHMLPHAPRVAELLATETSVSTDGAESHDVKVFILADTSYSACCVDEIAAEHADAQVVVHYGRTCLSPTSRIPAIFVYTAHELDHDAALTQFEGQFTEKDAKVVVMADLTYQNHVDEFTAKLKSSGYTNIASTEVVCDPGAVIPNRKITDTTLDEASLKSFSIFHISDPPTSLLLTLHTRFASLHVLSTKDNKLTDPTRTTTSLLRRRFAPVLTLSSAGVIGILVNTLSVSNYLPSIDALRRKIAAAGKKSYTVVVGKLNPAKLANFAEVEGWVVVGCWESGLIEDDDGYWRPVVTPFEMEVALLPEEERIWGGEWWGGLEKLTDTEKDERPEQGQAEEERGDEDAIETSGDAYEDDVSGEESQPPEYDLRTGRLVSHSRPMRLPHRPASISQTDAESSVEEKGQETATQQPFSAAALVKRTVGELASINGVASPGAEYLRSQRTWQGLGTDFADDPEASTLVEEGRSGVARGYQVGERDDAQRH